MILLAWLAGCAADCPAEAPADLVIEQIHTRGPSIGEATLVVGPDGTSVLIDVGNDAHTDALRASLRHHLGEERVDWVVLTHLHADHIGGFDDLFGGDDPIPVGEAVLWRGGEVGDDANAGEWEEVVDHPALVPLCDPGCDALLDTGIDLGDGATLSLTAANGTIAAGGDLYALPLPDDDENARSIAGVLRYGAFSYGFAGDLTGGGKDTPDVESFYAEHLADPWPDDGVDVLHLSHHGIRSSSNDAWLDRMLGSADHNAIVGANRGYLSAPAPSVLGRVGPLLGDGRIWAPAVGSIAGDHDALVVGHGPIVVRVRGDAYTIGVRDDATECERRLYSLTNR